MNDERAALASRCSPIRATPPPARFARSTRRSHGAGCARSVPDRRAGRRRPDRAHRDAVDPGRLGTSRRAACGRCDGIDAVIAFCREWDTKRQQLEFDTDGVVIKLDDLALRERLGRPRSSRAGRRPSSSPSSAAHELLRIDVNVGRTGAVTPFAVLEPVLLGGTTVRWRRCTTSRKSPAATSAGDSSSSKKAATSSRRSCAGAQPTASRRAWTMPRRAVLRQRAPARRTRSCGGARTSRVRRVSAAASSTSPAARDEHRGTGRIARRPARRQGLVRDYADLYALTPEQLECRRRAALSGVQEARQSANVTRRSSSRANELCGSCTASAFDTSGRAARSAGRGFGRCAVVEASVEALEAVPDVGAVVARSVRAFLTSRATPR